MVSSPCRKEPSGSAGRGGWSSAVGKTSLWAAMLMTAVPTSAAASAPLSGRKPWDSIPATGQSVKPAGSRLRGRAATRSPGECVRHAGPVPHGRGATATACEDLRRPAGSVLTPEMRRDSHRCRLPLPHGPRENLLRLPVLSGLVQAALRQGQAAPTVPPLRGTAHSRGVGLRRAPAPGHRGLEGAVRPAARRRPLPQELLRRTRIPPAHAEGGARTDDVRPSHGGALRQGARTPRRAVTGEVGPAQCVMPPPVPVDAHGNRSVVEAELGTRLPEDYEHLVEAYGRGEFCDYLTPHTLFGTRRSSVPVKGWRWRHGRPCRLG